MLAVSVGLSIVVHLLILLFPSLTIRFHTGSQTAAAGAQPARPFGMEMVVVIPSENAPELPVREESPTPTLRPAGGAVGGSPSEVTTPGAPGGAPGGSGTSAGDALRPGYRDSRLYVNPPPLPDIDRTDHERYMEHLQARFDALNDSMSVDASRNRRTSDWVVTDGSGNRWGISEDGLHLGGFTVPRELLPLPSATGDNQSLEAERERLRQRDEIRRQEEDRERARTQAERSEAMRRAADQRREGGGN